jgi:carbon storage regulator
VAATEGTIMLVLTRRVGETIVIDGEVRVTVLSVQGDRVRLGIVAPPDVVVDREEVRRRRAEEAARAVESCVV